MGAARPPEAEGTPLADFTGKLPLPLVRISGVLMRASTIPIAITLTLAPLPALPFDQDEFCVAVTDIAQRMNARKGNWLDRSTRHDGVEVDCESKTLEAKRFLNTDPDAMREGWEARKQRRVERHLLQS